MGRRGRKAGKLKFKRRYICGEQFRWDWQEDIVQKFIRDYIEARADGVDSLDIITGLAGKYKRAAPEVAMLIMDLGDRGYIGPQGKGDNTKTFRVYDCDEADVLL